MATLDQSQTNYTSPKPEGGFGNNIFPLFAQSFVPSATAQIHSVELALSKDGAVSTTIQLKIYSSSAGDPNAVLATANESLSTAGITDIDVGAQYSLHTFTFTAGPSLTSGTTYWMVLSTTSEVDNGAGDRVYVMGTAESNGYYAAGVAKTYDGATWAEVTGDGGFDFGFSEYYAVSSPSLSPSVTPSSSVSLSPSLSVSLSPSVTPSVSVSLSPSSSQSPSSSISLSPSTSVSLSPSLSPSLSISLSPSTSVSLSVSLSPSLSFSRSPSLSVSATPSASPSRSEYEDLYDLKSTSYTPKYTDWGPGNNMGGSGNED